MLTHGMPRRRPNLGRSGDWSEVTLRPRGLATSRPRLELGGARGRRIGHGHRGRWPRSPAGCWGVAWDMLGGVRERAAMAQARHYRSRRPGRRSNWEPGWKRPTTRPPPSTNTVAIGRNAPCALRPLPLSDAPCPTPQGLCIRACAPQHPDRRARRVGAADGCNPRSGGFQAIKKGLGDAWYNLTLGSIGPRPSLF